MATAATAGVSQGMRHERPVAGNGTAAPRVPARGRLRGFLRERAG